MVQALIFDIGGVIAYDVWENLFLDKKRGIASNLNLNPEEVKKIAKTMWDEFAHRSIDKEHDWKELEKEYWNKFIQHFHLSASVDYFINLTEQFICPIPETLKLLERLKSTEVKLAICSNNTEFWFKRQMDKLGLSKFFQQKYIILSSHIGASKSSPNFEMFEAVIEALNVDKRDCVFVDDREESILRAVEFGITGIIFPSHSERGARYLEALLQQMRIL
jgi:HAD superfamily hydrolase (TIGR01509 family)